MIYQVLLVWFIHLSDGALIDARTWGVKEKDPEWLAKYYDIIWLVYYVVGIFLLWFWFFNSYFNSDIPFLSFVGMNALAGFGVSVFWDLIYSKIEHGVWIYPLKLWFIIPTPRGRIPIGFDTEKKMLIFDIIRLYAIYTCLIIY